MAPDIAFRGLLCVEGRSAGTSYLLVGIPTGSATDQPVDEVASVTGWQRHTVRGVFSGP